MRTLLTLIMAIFLFTGIIILAENEPKVTEKPVCPYMEQRDKQTKTGEAECPYSRQQDMKQKSGVCPYSGKSLENSKNENKLQNEIEYKRSKKLLDEKLKIVVT